jgi:large subunit ribosomal protein L6
MSKIGNKPVNFKDAEVKMDGSKLEIKGPRGSLVLEVPKILEIFVDNETKMIRVKRKNDSKRAKEIQGTIRALINNCVKGVTEGFKKELIYEGVGYRAEIKDQILVLNVGYSHPVEYSIPSDIKIDVSEGKIIVEGNDKQRVGQVAAEIRAIKKPDAYKGHGIRYADEKLRLKPGKAVGKEAGEK